MHNIKSKAVLIIIGLTIGNFSYGGKIPDRILIKTGASYSLTQLDISPFSEFRRWYDRGIGSPFLCIEYAQPIKTNELTFGIQIIQKGFKTNLKPPSSPSFEYEQSYQYLLDYIEMPINYRHHYDKYSLSLGIIASYLYDDTYRFSESQILKNLNPPKYNNISFASQYPHPERYREWDFGINLGVSRKLTNSLDLEFTYQKHLIRVDKRVTADLAYNVCFLIGFRYRFLSNK